MSGNVFQKVNYIRFRCFMIFAFYFRGVKGYSSDTAYKELGKGAFRDYDYY